MISQDNYTTSSRMCVCVPVNDELRASARAAHALMSAPASAVASSRPQREAASRGHFDPDFEYFDDDDDDEQELFFVDDDDADDDYVQSFLEAEDGRLYVDDDDDAAAAAAAVAVTNEGGERSEASAAAGRRRTREALDDEDDDAITDYVDAESQRSRAVSQPSTGASEVGGAAAHAVVGAKRKKKQSSQHGAALRPNAFNWVRSDNSRQLHHVAELPVHNRDGGWARGVGRLVRGKESLPIALTMGEWFFGVFVPPHIVAHITMCINISAQRLKAGQRERPWYWRQNWKWPPKSAERICANEAQQWEVMMFMAMKMTMGITTRPHRSDFWSINWPMPQVFDAHVHLSRQRYMDISANWRVVDALERPAGESSSTWKVDPYFRWIEEGAASARYPPQFLSADEAMISMESKSAPQGTRLQMSSAKPIREGMVVDAVASSGADDPGLIFAMAIRKRGTTRIDAWTAIVNRRFRDGRHVLVFDRFNSVNGMAQCMLERGCYMIATLKANSEYIPPALGLGVLKWTSKPRGEWAYMSASLNSSTAVYGVRWKDSTDVFFMSTFSAPTPVTAQRRIAGEIGKVTIAAPSTAVEYNANKGKVDANDASRAATTCDRRRAKAYTEKVLCFFLDVSVTHSVIAWKAARTDEELKKKSGTRLKLDLVREMVDIALRAREHGNASAALSVAERGQPLAPAAAVDENATENSSQGSQSLPNLDAWLATIHMPVLVTGGRPRCCVCNGRPTMACSHQGCANALCVSGSRCFVEHHYHLAHNDQG